jgi:hypothetical protein
MKTSQKSSKRSVWVFLKRSTRVVILVYVLQLLWALTVGLQVYQVMEASIGDSLALQKLVSSFDFTVFTDFLKVHGASITPLIGQLRWLLLLWLVFSVFLQAGMLGLVSRGAMKAPIARFYKHARQYFFPFLVQAVLFLFLFFLVFLLSFVPVLAQFEQILAFFSSEKVLVGFLAISFLITTLGGIFLFMWSVESRLGYIRNHASAHKISIYKSISASFFSVFHRFWGRILIVLCGLGCTFLLWGLVSLLTRPLGLHGSSAALFAVFCMQQAVMIARVYIRLGVYYLMNITV